MEYVLYKENLMVLAKIIFYLVQDGGKSGARELAMAQVLALLGFCGCSSSPILPPGFPVGPCHGPL